MPQQTTRVQPPTHRGGATTHLTAVKYSAVKCATMHFTAFFCASTSLRFLLQNVFAFFCRVFYCRMLYCRTCSRGLPLNALLNVLPAAMYRSVHQKIAKHVTYLQLIEFLITCVIANIFHRNPLLFCTSYHPTLRKTLSVGSSYY